MKNNCKLGKLGEDFAKGYLLGQGYEIICCNYRCPFGEIDIIGKKDGRIAFVEVKTRTSQRFGMPADAVGSEKRRKIIAVARCFLSGYRGNWSSVDFQVMEILARHTTHLDFTEGQYVI